jgi:hypothetical protein
LSRELVVAADAADAQCDPCLSLVAVAPDTGAPLGAIVVAPAHDADCPHGNAAGWRLLHLSTAGGLAAGEQRAVRRQLAVALLEQALAAGVCQCGLHARPVDLPELLAVGWDLRPLGLAAAGSAAPFCVAVSRADLARLRRLLAESAGGDSTAFPGQQIGGEVELAS